MVGLWGVSSGPDGEIGAVEDDGAAEEGAEGVAVDEVGAEDADEDAGGGGGDGEWEEIAADGAGAAVLVGGGECDGDVDEHGAGHVKVVNLRGVVAVDQVEAWDHDHGAADTGDTAEHAGTKADGRGETELKGV